MLMIRDINTMLLQMMGMPVESKSGQNMLKQNGIDTNSKQYKAAMKMMNSSCGAGVGYTNPQAIKNLMRNFDANGKRISQLSGLAGVDATGIPMSQRHKIIKISEESKQEIFDAAKRAFISDFGTGRGGGEYRTEIYQNCQRRASKEDRLKASWTLGRYEEAYEKAFSDACLEADPNWKPGKNIPAGALKNVTREAVESNLVKVRGEYGETFVKKSFDVQI